MKRTAVTDEQILRLREEIEPYLPGRMAHTLGVEQAALRLGEIYLPHKLSALRCAALLHDITKRRSFSEQLQIAEEYGILIRPQMLSSPKILHAITGAALARDRFPLYATPDVVRGIRWHTTGRAGMSVFECLIYLADYIEENRTFPDCVRLREFFWNTYRCDMTDREKQTLLWRTMVMSFDMTLRCLVEEGAAIDRDTVAARNYFLELLANAE